MSIVYQVAVPQYRWPTFRFVNEALAKRGYPLHVYPLYESDDGAPLGPNTDLGELKVRFLDEDMELDVSCRPIGPNVERHVSPEEVNEHLDEIGADHRVTGEEWEYTGSFSSAIKPKYMTPHLLLLGVLVKDFGGFGYEGQTPSFGRDEWADNLLAEADANIAALRGAAAMQPGLVGQPVSLEPTRKPVFTFWRALAAIVVLLLVAEFIDKNVFNFTPALTGAEQDMTHASEP